MIRLTQVEKVYPSDPPIAALQGISMEVEKGEFLAVLGRSGSGKSTLLNLVGALTAPTSGIVEVDGMDLARISEPDRARFRNSRIGFVFQAFHILPDRSALDNVLLPARLAPHTVPDAREKAMASLERVGLKDRAHSYPLSLSGGQLQRVAIARALVMGPSLLLADEPTGNLDSATAEEIVDLFKRLHRDQNLTLLVVTHEDLITEAADRVLHLEEGKITEAGHSCPAEENR